MTIGRETMPVTRLEGCERPSFSAPANDCLISIPADLTVDVRRWLTDSAVGGAAARRDVTLHRLRSGQAVERVRFPGAFLRSASLEPLVPGNDPLSVKLAVVTETAEIRSPEQQRTVDTIRPISAGNFKVRVGSAVLRDAYLAAGMGVHFAVEEGPNGRQPAGAVAPPKDATLGVTQGADATLLRQWADAAGAGDDPRTVTVDLLSTTDGTAVWHTWTLTGVEPSRPPAPFGSTELGLVTFELTSTGATHTAP